VLQDHTIQRVGGEKSIDVDVRVMAASNRNVDERRRKGRFREDLYYRLSVVTFTVPPLRERTEDIPVLARSYLDYLRPRIGRDVDDIGDEAMEALVAYPWPGNVRELANVIERAMLLCHGDVLTVADLATVGGGLGGGTDSIPGGTVDPARMIALPKGWADTPWKGTRDRLLHEIEHRYLAELLQATGGRIEEAAKRAGMNSRSIFGKMKAHKLRKEDFR